MLYSDMLALRNSPTLLSRFLVAVEIQAVAIWTEPGITPNHANRILWAQRALFQTDRAQMYANLILRVAADTNATLQAAGEAVTDAQIQTMVGNYADAMATAGY